MSAPETTVFQHNFKVENDLHNVYANRGREAVESKKVFAEEISRYHKVSKKSAPCQV